MNKTVLILIAALTLGSISLILIQQHSLNSQPQHLGRPASYWVKDLAKTDYRVQNEARDALKALGSKAVPYLASELISRQFLKSALISDFGYKSFGFRRYSHFLNRYHETLATTLGDMGPAASAAVPSLIAALEDTDSEVRNEVKRALRRIGNSAITPLVNALSHEKAFVRERAAEVLGEIGTQSNDIIAALIHASRDSDASVRKAATVSLGVVGSQSQWTISNLVRLLKDNSPAVRAVAVLSLLQSSMNRNECAKEITPLLKDPDPLVRVHTAQCLYELNGRTDFILPVLIEALKDRNVSWQASLALGKMGEQASPAVNALVEAMKTEISYRPLRTTPSSVLALGRIGKSAAQPLIDLLESARVSVKINAVIALGLIGTNASFATPALISLLNHKDQELRQATALSLGTINPTSREIVPVLVQLVHDDDISISTTALTLLQKIAPEEAAQFRTE